MSEGSDLAQTPQLAHRDRPHHHDTGSPVLRAQSTMGTRFMSTCFLHPLASLPGEGVHYPCSLGVSEDYRAGERKEMNNTASDSNTEESSVHVPARSPQRVFYIVCPLDRGDGPAASL